jgi:hypothetical protein
MTRIVFALCMLAVLPLEARAADDASCSAAIRDAVASGERNGVPDTCWRIGPVAIGQLVRQVRDALGPPDTDYFVTDTAGAWPGMQTYRYVFPRNLRARIARHPIAQSAFKPVTLDVNFVDGRAAAIRLAADYWSEASKCAPRQPPPREAAAEMPFAYTFNGIGAGARLDRFVAQFGRWTRNVTASSVDDRGRRRDFTELHYRPVGLAVMTEGGGAHPRILALVLAPKLKDYAYYNLSLPYYGLAREPGTCLVTGFTLR